MKDKQPSARDSIDSYRIPEFDPCGNLVVQSGIQGAFGRRKYHVGQICDEDPLILAIRGVRSRNALSETESQLLRSFSIAWLGGYEKNLSRIVDFAVPLPPAVQYISRIGMIDRTVNRIAIGSATIAACVMFLELAWESATFDSSAATQFESTIHSVDMAFSEYELHQRLDEIGKRLDKSFGKPGEPIGRNKFLPEPIFDFIKMCQSRTLIDSIACNESVSAVLRERLDQRIFALFLANSRQIEGLTMNGAAEASIAVVAHTAMALGLRNESGQHQLLDRIDNYITLMKCNERKQEAKKTLACVRGNLESAATRELEIRVNRYLTTSTATEAVDWATFPVATALSLLGSVASGVSAVSGNTKAGSFLSAAATGFKSAGQMVESTPGAASQVIQSGVVAEEWTRNLIGQIWNATQRRKDTQ